MSLPQPGQAYYPTPAEIRDGILRRLRKMFLARGIKVNVLPDSDRYMTAEAVSHRIGLIVRNNKIAAADMSPLRAEKQHLDELAGVYGVTRRDATSARGFVEVAVIVTTVIPAGFIAVAPDGHRYATITANTVLAPGGPIEVLAKETGADTDQDEDTYLTWESAAIGNLDPVCQVDSNGLTGGNDQDSDEVLRARLIERLSFPGVGGNAAFVRETAEDYSSAVADAFVYSAVRGPASYDVAVLSDTGDRTLSTAVVSDVGGAVAGAMPGHCSLNMTTGYPELVDIVLYMSLPLPRYAGGAGGGWLDSTPFPASPDVGEISGVGTNYVEVECTVAPVVGLHISIWDPSEEAFSDFTVNGVTFLGGSTYRVFINPNRPAWVLTGMFVSTGASNLAEYATAFLAAMKALGSGEKTENPDLLPRSLRHPPPDVSSPMALTSVLLNAVTAEQTEILDISYGLRVESGTYPPGTTLTSPSIPPTTADPPRVLVLNNFAIVKV